MMRVRARAGPESSFGDKGSAQKPIGAPITILAPSGPALTGWAGSQAITKRPQRFTSTSASTFTSTVDSTFTSTCTSPFISTPHWVTHIHHLPIFCRYKTVLHYEAQNTAE